MKQAQLIVAAAMLLLFSMLASCGGSGAAPVPLTTTQASDTWDSATWDTATWAP